ncbi:MAG: response regulator [Sphingobacteriales bacterium]|jgi:DNA-binding NtrC family response regulator|nr:response regulator [Sphingobacteriales bacterium]
MAESRIKILYVDDEENNLNSFKAAFRREYDVTVALSALAAKELLKTDSFEIIITDQRMPGITGVDFLASIIDEYPEAIRMLLTGYADIQAVIDAINKGQIFQYITKPWDEQQMRVVINNAYEIFSLRKENKKLLQSLTRANEQLEFLLRQKLLS